MDLRKRCLLNGVAYKNWRGPSSRVRGRIAVKMEFCGEKRGDCSWVTVMLRIEYDVDAIMGIVAKLSTYLYRVRQCV